MLSQQPVLRQEQRLKMTPQLYQAIRIMAMPLQELQVTIQEELEQNPALEVMEDNSKTTRPLRWTPSRRAAPRRAYSPNPPIPAT